MPQFEVKICETTYFFCHSWIFSGWCYIKTSNWELNCRYRASKRRSNAAKSCSKSSSEAKPFICYPCSSRCQELQLPPSKNQRHIWTTTVATRRPTKRVTSRQLHHIVLSLFKQVTPGVLGFLGKFQIKITWRKYTAHDRWRSWCYIWRWNRFRLKLHSW